MSGNDFENQFYEGLDPHARAIVLRSEAEIDDANAKDAESTFKTGEALVRIQQVLEETSFKEWCSAKWPYHRTYAYDFIRVAEQLGPLRARLIDVRMPRASLIDLAKRPAQADNVLHMFEHGRRLSVQQVKSLLYEQDMAADAPAAEVELGGAKGLRALHHKKGTYLPLTIRRIQWLVERIESAVSVSGDGVRIKKGTLAENIYPVARLAHRELCSLCLHIEPDELHPLTLRRTDFPTGSRWGCVSDVLYTLGGKESWPSAAALHSWLTAEVLPLLQWATGTMPWPNEAPEHDSETEAGSPSSLTRAVPGVSPQPESEELQLGDYARTRLELDPFEFAIPQAAAKPGIEYEVLIEDDAVKWHPAIFVNGVWVLLEAGGLPCQPKAVRLCDKTVRLSIDFLVYVSRHAEATGTPSADRQTMATAIALQLVLLVAEMSTVGEYLDAERQGFLAKALCCHCARILRDDGGTAAA